MLHPCCYAAVCAQGDAIHMDLQRATFPLYQAAEMIRAKPDITSLLRAWRDYAGVLYQSVSVGAYSRTCEVVSHMGADNCG